MNGTLVRICDKHSRRESKPDQGQLSLINPPLFQQRMPQTRERHDKSFIIRASGLLYNGQNPVVNLNSMRTVIHITVCGGQSQQHLHNQWAVLTC